VRAGQGAHRVGAAGVSLGSRQGRSCQCLR
jgi:hypothetical protein